MAAIADLTDLWQAAATLMGEVGTHRILNAASPSTPLELTFEDLYTRARLQMLRKVDPLFARRTELLREAPSHDAFGNVLVWNSTWNYTYREPSTSIKFRGFRRDRADFGLVKNFSKAKLPIYYTTAVTTGEASGVYTLPAQVRNMYRGYAHCEFTDEEMQNFIVVDSPQGDADDHMDFAMENGAAVGVATTDWLYHPVDSDAGTGLFDVTGGDRAWDASPTYPSSLTFNVAYKPTSHDEWSDNIHANFTDSDGVHGVFTIDEDDPSVWTEEFQDLVALELARKAAVVHAKSTKLLRALNNESVLAMSAAITQDTSEDDNLESQIMSSSERARG